MFRIRLLAAVATVVLLHACGGGGSDNSGGADTATPTAPVAPTTPVTPTSPTTPSFPALAVSTSAGATVEGGQPVSLSVSGGDPADVPLNWTIAPAVGALGAVSNTGATYTPPGPDQLVADTDVVITATTRSGTSLSKTIGVRVSALRTTALAPTAVDVGETSTLSIVATPVIPLPSTAWFAKAIDVSGVIAQTVVVSTNADGSLTLSLTTRTDVAPGSYTGVAKLLVCYDADCATPVPGRALQLPFTVNVAPNTGLRPLTAWAGVNDWETFQQNPSHTGYVPVTLNPVTFGERWTWKAPANGGTVYPVTPLTTSGGRVHLASGNLLHVLNEADSLSQWTYDVSSISQIAGFPATNPPAATGGKVYMAAGHQNTTFMFAFDAATGNVLFKSTMSSQWENYYAPTVFGDSVYTAGGTYGGIYAFGATSGEQRFFAYTDQYDQWTPAVDSAYAYAFTGLGPSFLRVIDRATGALVRSIAVPNTVFQSYDMLMAPVLGAPDSVILSSRYGALSAVNVAAGTVRWSISGGFIGNPAYEAGTIYATNQSPIRMEVRRETDGALQWQWTPQGAGETTFVGDVLLTRNLCFVSTNTTTYAIDLKTRLSVWKYPKPSRLALSANRVLYVSPTDGYGKSDGTVVAFNVK